MISGVGLLIQGLSLLDRALREPSEQLLLDFLAREGLLLQNSGVLLIAAALLIGWVKGRMVLVKVAQKYLLYLSQLHEPIRFTQWLQPRQWLLILLMAGLAVGMRLFGSWDIRAIVCIAVGSALTQGGWWTLRKTWPATVQELV
ncbi:MAG: hypothetical protein ACOYKZ_07890 [Chlamydiia bacterium]